MPSLRARFNKSSGQDYLRDYEARTDWVVSVDNPAGSAKDIVLDGGTHGTLRAESGSPIGQHSKVPKPSSFRLDRLIQAKLSTGMERGHHGRGTGAARRL